MATYIGKVNVGGSTLPVGSTLYGTCGTAANTAAKVVTMANFDELITGVTIHVKFTYSNTVANPTLNVNSTGAKNIYRYGTTAPSTSAETSWNAGAVVSFTYDGSYWQMNDWVNDNNKYTAASATPAMDGTAAVGTSTKYAREDHVHPSDTSRVPTSRKVNNKALSADISLTASDVGAIATSAKGAASGVAELDENGKVPSGQLPSFVDDVLEYNGTSSFPTTGEAGKIYVDTSTNKTYRWGGSSYTEISASLALGETSSTAYRGDRGKTAYTHATDSSRLTTATSSGLYKVASTAEGHIASLTAVAKSDITALGIPSTNTWTAMTGATSSANGTVGYVNAVPPKDGYNTKYLRADGTWSVPPDNNTTYGLSISDHTVSLVSGGTTSSVTVPDNNTKYGLSISGHTVSLVEGGTTASVTVPDNNDNNAVTQTVTTTSADYEVLFSSTADNTTRTEGARKNSNLKFNPSTGNLQVTKINGVDVGSSPKFTDNNTKYGLSISGHTVSLVEGGSTASVTVPDNNDNNAVTQTATSTSANYEVLFSATADNTTRTEGARKNSNMTFNPNTGNLQVTQINGVTVGSSPKFTDNNTTYGLSISDHTVSLVAGGSTSSVTVPDNNTTYTAGTGLSLSGTKFNHSNSVTAATVGTSSATSGQTIAVPYVTYDAQGHITATGTHTHTSSVPPSGVVRGDDSTVGGLDPVTAAYIPTAASNKSFGLPANAITIEYSTNAGSTWTSYGATDAEKRNLFNESRATSFYLGKATAKANNTVNNRLRVTIEPTDRYCSFHGIYIWFSTQGNTTVMDLERSTIGAKDTYTTVFTGQALSGWSGNNIRYFSYGTFGGGSTQTGNTYKYRVTFRQTAVNTNYASSIVMDIRFLGDNIWTYPSDTYVKNMLMNRTAYGVDATGNVTFPQGVVVSGSGANGFIYSGIEAGTGNADRCVWFADSSAVGRPVYDNDFKYNPSSNNLTVGKINGYTIAASVPSGAKFTDTTYTANTTSIGSASAGTAIPADDITKWTANTPASASVANGVLTITNGSAATLEYTAKSIPNISVTSKTVATGITAS